MARTLTTPIVQPPCTQQGITRFTIDIPHVFDEVDGEMKINKDHVKLKYAVITFNESGEAVTGTERTVPFADWPALFKTDVKEVYAKIEIDAENAGLIGAGEDELLE